jgi:hypothetical protein
MKRPELEFKHLPPSSVEVKNEWSFRPVLLPLYAFMAWTGKTYPLFKFGCGEVGKDVGRRSLRSVS